jgi:hypothetical protein
MFPCPCPYFHVLDHVHVPVHFHVHVYFHVALLQTENKINLKQQLPFVAAEGKRKRQTSICLLQTEKKMKVCFPWLANNKQ